MKENKTSAGNKRAKRDISELNAKPGRTRSGPDRRKSAGLPPSERKVQILQYLYLILAIFAAFCLIAPEAAGKFGVFLSNLLKGFFSIAACFVPFLIANRAIYCQKDLRGGKASQNWLFSLICLFLLSLLFAIIGKNTVQGFSLPEHWQQGIRFQGGGLIGGLLYNLLSPVIGKWFTLFLTVSAGLIFFPFLFSATPVEALRIIVRYIRTRRAKKHTGQQTLRRRERPAESVSVTEDAPAAEPEEEKAEPVPATQTIPPEDPVNDDPNRDITDTKLFEETEQKSASSMLAEIFTEVPGLSEETGEIPPGEEENIAQADLVFPREEEEGEAPALRTEKSKVVTDEPPEQKEIYRFPPISLLTQNTAAADEYNAEYEQTGKRLVETLASFHVKTKILNISKGPTVTRYELQPDVGVRVRAIKNLSDDIALNLAAKGVRIEAPIPGKEAVGIEIPNKKVSMVYIRELIEIDSFSSAKSRLTACLGKDVAGNPVYCDLSKMPHLLIAGATGMGKSVCINSILMSILYKATPDEVKLILIDPKKVEMGIYNGIPHLLVPVVSDPKKAAGALCWAVTEMERRFALIEEAGVRDITSYNRAVAEDAEKEKMSQIVIIIDELADLMMTARDEVETSICRLAQKARAAGMHLVIGTQRPSVDVITGLIKANIPSRIAFTVASQIDSRTIIDINGAEKLIGRGDMLYAPVGSTNPLRVQGSFVSDEEINSVIDFIKKAQEAQYSEEVMESIEQEAMRCGERGKGKDQPEDGGGETIDLNSDPVLRQAIEYAYEAGSISTSYLQRKLKLGFARAGRIVDMMEELGIIGPFAGSKPREVIMPRQRYLEMLNRSED